MKKIISAFLAMFILSFMATAQLESIDSPSEGGGTPCTSRTSNNGYCNKYSGGNGLPSYTCETTSCHGATCFDCVK